MKQNIFSVLIYGCGNIGFRHFQGIIKSNYNIKIYLYDLKINNYQIFIDELKINKIKNKQIICLSKILKKITIDLVIMSSPSKNRYNSILKVVDKINSKLFLIEKIPFQKVNEYKKIKALFYKKKIKAWINCPRRYWENFSLIKKKYFINNNNNITVKGSNWKLTSNAIHFLDLFEFFNNNSNLTISNSKFINKVYETNRKNYFNLLGEIKFTDEKRNRLFIKEYFNRNDLMITISNNKYIAKINQIKQKYKVYSLTNNKLIKKGTFFSFNQSIITQFYIDDLILNNNLKLLDFNKSLYFNELLIKEFICHFSKILNKRIIACPIT